MNGCYATPLQLNAHACLIPKNDAYTQGLTIMYNKCKWYPWYTIEYLEF